MSNRPAPDFKGWFSKPQPKPQPKSGKPPAMPDTQTPPKPAAKKQAMSSTPPAAAGPSQPTFKIPRAAPQLRAQPPGFDTARGIDGGYTARQRLAYGETGAVPKVPPIVSTAQQVFPPAPSPIEKPFDFSFDLGMLGDTPAPLNTTGGVNSTAGTPRLVIDETLATPRVVPTPNLTPMPAPAPLQGSTPLQATPLSPAFVSSAGRLDRRAFARHHQQTPPSFLEAREDTPATTGAKHAKSRIGDLIMGAPFPFYPRPAPTPGRPAPPPTKKSGEQLLREKLERANEELREAKRQLMVNQHFARSIMDPNQQMEFRQVLAGKVPDGWMASSELPNVVKMTEKEVIKEIVQRGFSREFLQADTSSHQVSDPIAGIRWESGESRARDFLRDMRDQAFGAPIKAKHIPQPNLVPDCPTLEIQKVAATFQGLKVPSRTHQSQAVSQKQFDAGLTFHRPQPSTSRSAAPATITSPPNPMSPPRPSPASSPALPPSAPSPQPVVIQVQPSQSTRSRPVFKIVKGLTEEERPQNIAERKALLDQNRPPKPETRSYQKAPFDLKCMEEGCGYLAPTPTAYYTHKKNVHTFKECQKCGGQFKTGSINMHQKRCKGK